jgi:hypothetical protein
MDFVTEIKVPRKAIGRRWQGFSFDMYCWCFFSEYTQLAFDEFDVLGDDKFMRKMIYCAAVSYNKSKGKRVNFNEREVQKWIDRSYTEDWNKVVAAMKKSRIGGDTLEDLMDQAEGQKKKSGTGK